MGGQHLHLPTGMDQPLHARGRELISPLQPFLHQSPLIWKLGLPADSRHRQSVEGQAQAITPLRC